MFFLYANDIEQLSLLLNFLWFFLCIHNCNIYNVTVEHGEEFSVHMVLWAFIVDIFSLNILLMYILSSMSLLNKSSYVGIYDIISFFLVRYLHYNKCLWSKTVYGLRHLKLETISKLHECFNVKWLLVYRYILLSGPVLWGGSATHRATPSSFMINWTFHNSLNLFSLL